MESPISPHGNISLTKIPDASPDDPPVKLFVGQVPKTATEDDLLKIFSSYGHILEVAIVRDKATREHRGCAFISFAKESNAKRAITELHDQYVLSPSTTPLQIRLATGEAERLEPKLFIGMIPRELDVEAIKRLFEPFGPIVAFNLLYYSDGSSRGCGFVTFQTRSAALSAIEAMNGKKLREDVTNGLVVRWADTPQQRQQRRVQNQLKQAANMLTNYAYYAPYQYQGYWAGQSGDLGGTSMAYEQHGAENTGGGMEAGDSEGKGSSEQDRVGPEGRKLFVCYLPKEMREPELKQLFEVYGTVEEVRVCMDRATGSSKCYGFVTFEKLEAAQWAQQGLNGYTIGEKRLKVEFKK